MSSVTFSHYKERPICSVLRILIEELNDKLIEIRGDLILVTYVVRAIGISSSNWLINIEHVGVLVPTVGIQFQTQIVINFERPVLVKDC